MRRVRVQGKSSTCCLGITSSLPIEREHFPDHRSDLIFGALNLNGSQIRIDNHAASQWLPQAPSLILIEPFPRFKQAFHVQDHRLEPLIHCYSASQATLNPSRKSLYWIAKSRGGEGKKVRNVSSTGRRMTCGLCGSNRNGPLDTIVGRGPVP